MSIIFAILIFSFLIFIHEFGHFFTAKLFGVKVNEFAMFMGPAIWKKQKGETQYSIRCIPIGGYCAMEGENEDTDSPRSFQKASWWKRLIILVAGSFMNILVGFLLVVIVNFFATVPTTQIESLRSNSSLAWENNIQPGDVIVEINGMKLERVSDFDLIMQKHEGETEFDVLVVRDGKQVLVEDVTMIQQQYEKDDEGEAGLFYGLTWATRNLSFAEVITTSWNDCVYFAKSIWMSLGMLITGQAQIQDLSGPVGIVGIMNSVAAAAPSWTDALLNLLFFGAFIAVNLGVMNLLPIPALDGGRDFALLITTAIVKIRKKPINPKFESYIHGAGMVLLLAFMAVIMLKDILMLF